MQDRSRLGMAALCRMFLAALALSPALPQALEATLNVHRTHPLPQHLPEPPSTWSVPFGRLAGDIGLE